MDLNVGEIKSLVSPRSILDCFPTDDADRLFIDESRRTVENILDNKDNRFMVIVGPCSIHDTDLALDYAEKHIIEFQKMNPNLFVIMRVYFEKPRTRTGWKGLICDPDLDNSCNIEKGLFKARELLFKLTKMRVRVGCEFLETITPQYFADLVTWGAIGARTSESQVHRQLASGLSMPVGFKNLTDGRIEPAIDGIISAGYPHQFIGSDYDGKIARIQTKGNKYAHLILRGGTKPNYYQSDIEDTLIKLSKDGIDKSIVIDCSHGNSQKEHRKQLLVAFSLARMIRSENKLRIKGVMIESNIFEGSQKITPELKYGVSITDACIDIETTHFILNELNDAVTSSKRIESLDEARDHLRLYEDSIIQLRTDGKFILPKSHDNFAIVTINVDDEIYNIAKHDVKLMALIHRRISFAEIIAYKKFTGNMFNYLLKYKDLYKLITDIDREKAIMSRVKDDIYLKIIEITKQIQVKYLEKVIPLIKIGFLGNKGTFSYQAITQNFRGSHVGFNTMEELTSAFKAKLVDYVIIPTYNSLVGSIDLIKSHDPYKVMGSLDHQINLSLFANKEFKLADAEILYVQSVVFAEVKEYYVKTLEKYSKIIVIIVPSTEIGCIECIKDSRNALTISGTNNECNFLKLLDKNIVEHNITTFSLIST
jgi:3-deoxy-7-phosphoheptulonate synthase